MAQMATRNFDQRVTDRAIGTRSLNIFPSVFSLGILTFLKISTSLSSLRMPCVYPSLEIGVFYKPDVFCCEIFSLTKKNILGRFRFFSLYQKSYCYPSAYMSYTFLMQSTFIENLFNKMDA